MAKLYFRYGAMNSGKSTALMQVAHNYEEQGMRVLILKPQVDTKGGGELVSRLGVRRKADLLIPPETDVFEAVRQANSTAALACVLCDESQFFTPEQAEQLFMVTVDLNIPVICYGLRADFSLKGFPGSTRLLELDNAFHRRSFELIGMAAHYDYMLASLQHVERIRKFSLQTEENKSVCATHTAILEALLHGSPDDVSEALESHLSRYKQSVAQARSIHPEYFIDE